MDDRFCGLSQNFFYQFVFQLAKQTGIENPSSKEKEVVGKE
jgi:hypothetical protein